MVHETLWLAQETLTVRVVLLVDPGWPLEAPGEPHKGPREAPKGLEWFLKAK